MFASGTDCTILCILWVMFIVKIIVTGTKEITKWEQALEIQPCNFLQHNNHLIPMSQGAIWSAPSPLQFLWLESNELSELLYDLNLESLQLSYIR